MTRILVTNDDGVDSPGLAALAVALAPLGEVTVVAPMKETSAIGHALTLHNPLRLERVRDRVFAVDGTPTDCVTLGVFTVLGSLPDLVVSGINRGLNIGDDVTYSGTVGGALEAVLLGVPGVAVSVDKSDGGWEFGAAARIATTFAEAVLDRGLPPRVLLNINVPKGEPHGIRVTVQGRRNHSTSVSERIDVRGRPYFWIGMSEDDWLQEPNSDRAAVSAGIVSVTPLQTDLTAYDALEFAEELSKRGEAEVR
jgi:5'-nucleotidase